LEITDHIFCRTVFDTYFFGSNAIGD
jgi:hypothetical protein